MQATHAVTGKWTKCLVMTLAAFAFGLSTHAGAAAEGTGPCAAEVAKFCSGVRPGGGRIARCLKANESELAPACKERIAETVEKLREVGSACGDDTFKFCKNIRSGRGRLLRCLKRHEGELSGECKAKVGKAKTDEQL